MNVIEVNGARIPQLGLGTWELRGPLCTRIVEQALRLGYRHIDTAEMYGNEREVGEGLRASRVPREEVFVTTKIWPEHFAPLALMHAAQESLRKLKLPHVDLLLLHWPSSSVPLEETLGALNAAKDRGFTKHIGISNFTPDLVEQAVKLSKAPIVTDQIKLHPFTDQSETIAACKRHGVSITAHSPIAKGAAAEDGTLAAIGTAHRKSATQVCLRYLLQQGFVVIPRTSRVERLIENAAVFDFELSAGEMKTVRDLARS
jgi:2,5-diketo-D-gluconate reductase B